MRKLIFILILIIANINSFSQDVVGSRVIAKQSFYLRDRWVDSIRIDTVGLSGDNGSLMTAGAIYKFVSNRIGGGGSNTDSLFGVQDNIATQNRLFDLNGGSRYLEINDRNSLNRWGLYSAANNLTLVQIFDDGVLQSYSENVPGAYFQYQYGASSANSGIDISATGGNAFVGLFAGTTSTHYNNIRLYEDSILIMPFLGQLNVDSLRDGASYSVNKLIGWRDNNGVVGYVTPDYGLTMASALLKVDTFSIATRAALYKVVDSLPSGATYTADLPIRVTGTVISADTSVAYTPSLVTNARLQKIIDSLPTGGGGAWNDITSPTGDQALTFQAGESSTWTDQNTTEDLFTVNSSTGTTNSIFSLNRTGTALAAGNNIMELVSSGANGTGTITSTALRISNTNTGTTSTNVGLNVITSGATNNYAILAQGYIGISTPTVGAFTPTASIEIKDADAGVTSFQVTGTDGQFRLKIREYGSYIETFSSVAQVYNSYSAGRLNLGGYNVGDQLAMFGTYITVKNRFNLAQGSDVASAAGAIALGTGGNSFEITGTDAITLISNATWQNGSIVTLLFTSTATLTDGTANSGTDIGMELAGNTNFVASAGATLTLILSEIGGTQRWREMARSVQ
jgi:hypothetical protein